MPTAVVSALKFGGSLGSGHFSTVYEADHMIHGPVAVKVYERLDGESDEKWFQRRDELLVEGRRLKKSQHDRVVKVYDISHDAYNDKVYLVLELCPGGTLEDRCKTGPLSLLDTRNFVNDVTLGLDCIHARNFIHRDIKPANLLIGADGRAKIGDFGLVTDRIVLGYGSMRGYSDHIAIEVWTGCKTSIRSDVWALGMTVYRLLHGQMFYKSLEKPRRQVPAGNYAQHLPWLPHVPRPWRAFVRKCMHDDPNRRYQNAQQVLSGLSTLPVTPIWSCDYSPKLTTWTRRRGSRIDTVIHEVRSPRKHYWEAISRPENGVGRNRRLAGSDGEVGRLKALRALEDFLLG